VQKINEDDSFHSKCARRFRKKSSEHEEHVKQTRYWARGSLTLQSTRGRPRQLPATHSTPRTSAFRKQQLRKTLRDQNKVLGASQRPNVDAPRQLSSALGRAGALFSVAGAAAGGGVDAAPITAPDQSPLRRFVRTDSARRAALPSRRLSRRPDTRLESLDMDDPPLRSLAMSANVAKSVTAEVLCK
jgi:hypothetical protein